MKTMAQIVAHVLWETSPDNPDWDGKEHSREDVARAIIGAMQEHPTDAMIEAGERVLNGAENLVEDAALRVWRAMCIEAFIR